MRAATEAARSLNAALMVLAVTALTCLDDYDLDKLGVHGRVQDQVLRLADMAIANGCHGVVASAREASAVRNQVESDFAIVTPGVRPAGAEPGDRARVVTPAEVIAAGATHVVAGRPTTGAADPASEACPILGQISF